MSRRVGVVLVVCALVVAVVAALFVSGADDSPGDAPAAPSGGETTSAPSAVTSDLTGTPGADGIGDPYFPSLGNGGYDVEHYELELEWLPDQGLIEGVTTIDARATQDLSRFNLDLAGLDVSAVTVDGTAAAVERTERELVVTPSMSIAEGSAFQTVVTYGGEPVPIPDGTDLFDAGWQVDGREAFVISEPAGASTFFPVNDHPSDKATYSFEITAPDDQVVAANGLLVGEPVERGPGALTWAYEADAPMASYLVQIAIGDYVLEDAGEVGGVQLRHALHRSYAEQARRSVSRTGEMLEVLVDVFGPYPFDAYGVVAVDEPLGFALETQTLTIIGSDVGTQGRGADAILLHELAHQWVGNAVSVATWDEIWLNEGFATYAEWLWTERTGGAPAADTARAVARGLSDQLDTPPGDPGNQELFQLAVYWRGALALQALRESIGDDDFFELLPTWIEENGGGVASTGDLVEIAERVSGDQLDDLFEAWIYERGLPALG